jgi:transposase-like protein
VSKKVSKNRLRVVDREDVQEIEACGVADEVVAALSGIADVAREGLLALSVTAGLQVMATMLEEERTRACGPMHAKLAGREATRGGTTPASVVLGGRKVPVRRPRARYVDGGGEVMLPAWEAFSDESLLDEVVFERMLAGLATRRHHAANEPMGEAVEAVSSGTSKSAVSRRWVRGTQAALDELLTRDLSELDVAVLMIDGVNFADTCCVVALVITADGTKVPVGLREGDTENGRLVKDLLADLVARGLRDDQALLVVIDGAKALDTAVRAVFDKYALIQRCQLHKRRNVTDYLPKRERGWVEARMVRAFKHADPDQVLADARRLATELEARWPSAAGSLREGLEDMFTVSRLGIDGRLAKTLTNTNAIESMISIARTVTARVKRWHDNNKMRQRWCAAGMLEAERSFRRVKGHKQMPRLVAALQRHTETVTRHNYDQNTVAA